MDVDSVKALSSFPTTTSNDVHFDVEIVKSNNEYGTLTITLIATKNDATKKQELTISGFQTQAQAIANKSAVDNYQKLIDNVSQTTTKRYKLSSTVTYDDVANFNRQTNVDLDLPPSNIKVVITSENTDGQQVVTFTISKGDQVASHQITVTGFQTQFQAKAQANVDRAKRYLDRIENTISGYSVKPDKQKYNNLQDLLAKTILTESSFSWDFSFLTTMTITFKAVSTKPTFQTVTATISQTGAISATSTFEVSGFS